MKNNIISRPIEIDTKNTAGLLLISVFVFSSFYQPFWSPIPQLVIIYFIFFTSITLFNNAYYFLGSGLNSAVWSTWMNGFNEIQRLSATMRPYHCCTVTFSYFSNLLCQWLKYLYLVLFYINMQLSNTEKNEGNMIKHTTTFICILW